MLTHFETSRSARQRLSRHIKHRAHNHQQSFVGSGDVSAKGVGVFMLDTGVNTLPGYDERYDVSQANAKPLKPMSVVSL